MSTYYYTIDLHYQDAWSDQASAEVTLIQHHPGAGTTEALCCFWFKADPARDDEPQAPAHLQPAAFPDAPLSDDPKPYARWRFDRIETPSLHADDAITLLCRTADVIADVQPETGDVDELDAFLTALEAQGIAHARPVEVWGEARMAILAGLGSSWSRAAQVDVDTLVAAKVSADERTMAESVMEDYDE